MSVMSNDLHATASLPATVVVGLGRTGLSCVRWLARQGMDFAITDDRTAPPGLTALQALDLPVPVSLGRFDTHLLEQAHTIVLSPGIDPQHPELQSALQAADEVIGDIELFARHAKAPVIAITGANGKSTVTTLVTAMAQCAGLDVRMGGNIGTPALDLLDDCEPDLYVLELSSFQLDTTHSLNAAAAAVLNISPDHMDRYSGLKAYADSKARVYRGDGVMVLNRDDERVMGMADASRQRLSFGLDPAAEDALGICRRDGQDCLMYGQRALLRTSELRIGGTHNYSNALAALALGMAVNLPEAAMLEALKAFTGLPHRCQWVAEIDGVNWINDSKGTNVGATLAALSGYPRDASVVLIAGGVGKGADFAPLAEVVRGRVHTAVVYGRDAAELATVLAPVCTVRAAEHLQQAVAQARACSRPGQTVLFSPACASLDQFINYEARGEAFMLAVGGSGGER